MPDERTAGVIVFRRGAAGWEYLIIRNRNGGHWGFPKGRLEPGEDELAAARREVAEEVGIRQLALQPGFKERLAYRFLRAGAWVDKEVTLFLAATAEAGAPEGDEVEDLEWLPLPAALARLPHPEQRAALLRAAAFLQGQAKG